jgi:protein-S-isoprenylcysteine O-methyltransferase Ste14
VTLFLENLLFTIVAPGTLSVWLPLALARGAATATGPRRFGAFALFTAGGSLYLWCVWNFASFGRGTPAPIDAPKRLVARGPYRFVRNPMYLSVLAVILGHAAYFLADVMLAYGAAVALAFHLFVVVYEEPHLLRRFGTEYANYLATTRRWLPTPPRGRSGPLR